VKRSQEAGLDFLKPRTMTQKVREERSVTSRSQLWNVARDSKFADEAPNCLSPYGGGFVDAFLGGMI
jgi:hypothetical protein